MKGDRQIGRRKPGQSHMSELGSAEVHRRLPLLAGTDYLLEYICSFFFAEGKAVGGGLEETQEEEGGGRWREAGCVRWH